MSDSIRIFINEQPFLVRPGSTVREAVAAFDVALAQALAEGRAFSTDGVGRLLAPAAEVVPGAIIRVVVSARGATSR